MRNTFKVLINVGFSLIIQNLQCTVPEKIHTHPMEGHWKFLGGGGS